MVKTLLERRARERVDLSPAIKPISIPVARGPVPRDRCMARDRPSPYGEGAVFYRSAGACPPRSNRCSERSAGDRPAIVTWRGTGPRLTVIRSTLCRSRSPDLDPFGSRRSRTPVSGPGEGHLLACASGMARDRPSPYGKTGRFFSVAWGPVPREPRNIKHKT